jgi:acyl CoA:acetate/3-ketoacid CoA transferase alpha subunit
MNYLPSRFCYCVLKEDEAGKPNFKGTARNFTAVMAGAKQTITIAEVENYIRLAH